MNGVLLGVIAGGIPVPASPTDPFFDDVILLMPFDDSIEQFFGNYESTIIYNDINPSLSSVQSRFGTNSALFSTATILEIATSEGAINDTENTVESWVYVTALGSEQTVASKYQAGGTEGFFFQVNASGTITLVTSSPSGFNISTSVNSLIVNTWHHVAASWDSTSLRVYLDGNIENDEPNVHGYSSNPFVSIRIGVNPTLSPVRAFNGYMSEFRYTDAARYTSSFTPPSAPFPRS